MRGVLRDPPTPPPPTHPTHPTPPPPRRLRLRVGHAVAADDLSVFFGDHEAPTTQCWSTSTLICTLPPAVTPGPVVVSVRSVYGPVAAAVNVAQLWPRETGATLSDARPPASVPAPASGPILFVYKDGTHCRTPTGRFATPALTLANPQPRSEPLPGPNP